MEFDPSDHTFEPYQEIDSKIDQQENANASDPIRVVVKIDYDLCEATGVCAQVCPEDVLEHKGGQTHVVKPEACTECWICVENCVSGAVEIG